MTMVKVAVMSAHVLREQEQLIIRWQRGINRTACASKHGTKALCLSLRATRAGGRACFELWAHTLIHSAHSTHSAAHRTL